MPTPHSKLSSGFTLVEMAMVLLIIGLILGSVLSVSGSMRESQNRQLVRTQLDALDTALANFVAQNKRLPCPANGTLASNTLNAGIETLSAGPPPAAAAPKGTCGPANQINGVIPWVTLGLSESDATDPWNGRFTYRVYPPLAMQAQSVGISPLTPVTPPAGLMDMTACDPASTVSGSPVPITGLCGGFNAATGCTQCKPNTAPCNTANLANCVSPTNYLANKGLDVWNGVGAWATRQNNPAAGTGAAYVIISHGPSGRGAYNSAGNLQPGSAVAGSNETPNLNNQALALPSALGTTYRDSELNDVASAAHFDDYLSHPTIMSVLNKANLGPRAH
ncbi:type II secretion system protein [Undibacterium sp. RuTC16W]|uniref:type II secretion system protein n=1 Tax=Undibacterium sp. RuTC16W TaxID=3413048 RepID=UPI003BF28DB1